MGTKGRDLVLYLFFASAAGVVTGRLVGFSVTTFFCVVVTCGVLIVDYYCRYLPGARRMSKEMGLECVVLLPMWGWWAGLLIKLAGNRIRGDWRQAFEVHVEIPEISLGEYLRALDRDLNLARQELQGCLFIWETSAPLPTAIRSLVRQGKKNGWAFWEEGSWPIPRFPCTALELKKGRVKRGAIFLRKECPDE